VTARKRTSATTLRQIDDRLVAFEGTDPNSSRGKHHYCYVLQTARGNVMVHPPDAPTFIATSGDRLDALGGVQWIFLTHYGDANPNVRRFAERWQLRLLVHEADLEIASNRIGERLTAETFREPFSLDSRCDVLLFPGHTAGYSCMSAKLASGTYLLSGHLIVESKLAWHAAASRERAEASVDSLRRLAALEVDFLLPELTWDDAESGERAPLAFGDIKRQEAVQSALRYLARKSARPMPNATGALDGQ
jgi:glyoxylase-like metal-dependent hydrolase (beta-lactamase superfamily II)